MMSLNAGVSSGDPSSSTAALVSPDAKLFPDAAADCALEKECAAILEAVERSGGSVPRRNLQKKLWRIKAKPFNCAIELLKSRGLILVDGKMVAIIREVRPRPDSPLFHGVPQPDANVPRIKSDLGPGQSAGTVNGIRGGLYTKHREEMIEKCQPIES
jgi:hypothetical protein